MTITRNFKLCLNAGTQNAPYINANQYDEGEEWVFDLYTEGGQKFTPSTGAIIGIKSDGNAILNSGTVNSDGQVVITETQQMTAASGLAVFELLIEGETHGTANFIVNVERRPSDDAEFSDSDLSMLQEAIDSAAEIEDLLGGQDVPTVITPIIADWLDDNITNPSNPPIDTSLTVAGAAADAKKTGDEITDLKSAITNRVSNDELQEGYKVYTATYNHGWISGNGVYNPSDNRYISNGISTSDIVEVVNNSNVVIYVDYFTQFTDFTSFQLATYTQLNPGQSTLIDRYYPTVCVLSAATQESGLEGLLIKGTSQIEYLSKAEHDDIVSDLDSLESEFVDLFTNNAFLATSYRMNGYWNLSSHGVFKADANYVAVNDYMPVDAGATYYCGSYNKTSKGREISAIAGIFIYYDEDKNYISSEQGTKASITIPAGANYLRVSITVNAYNNYLLGMRKNSAMNYWYPPVKKVLNHSDKFFTVGHNGTEDFYYLKEAVENATQYENVTVRVSAGTYDLVAEYGSDWLEAMTPTQTEKGLVLKNNIHLVFSPLSVVTFHYRGTNENVQTRFSPFNSGEKGFTIEGLTLKASNCRYCVHDERSGGTEPYTNKYINCDFDFDNSLNTVWSASQIIGGGLGKQGNVLIENCVFYTYRTTFVVANAVSYHNHSQADSKSLIVVKDCYFKENNGMRFSWYGASTLITQILVSNNSMGRAIETRAETQDSTIENINVIAWNNEIRTA